MKLASRNIFVDINSSLFNTTYINGSLEENIKNIIIQVAKQNNCTSYQVSYAPLFEYTKPIYMKIDEKGTTAYL